MAFALAGLIMLEPDFGTASIIVMVVIAIVFAAGLNYRYLFGAFLALAPAATALVLFSSYRRKRLMTFLNPWSDPLGDGFQIIQSLYAVGSGGIFGKGLMAGIQKLYYIPEPHTDFIYAVIAEELGLIGTTLTLLCFVVIMWRGLRASLLAPDRFGVAARARHHADDRAPGVREHQRRHEAHADQGHSAAVREQRRIVAADQSGGGRHSPQHLSAGLAGRGCDRGGPLELAARGAGGVRRE